MSGRAGGTLWIRCLLQFVSSTHVRARHNSVCSKTLGTEKAEVESDKSMDCSS